MVRGDAGAGVPDGPLGGGDADQESVSQGVRESVQRGADCQDTSASLHLATGCG